MLVPSGNPLKVAEQHVAFVHNPMCSLLMFLGIPTVMENGPPEITHVNGKSWEL